MQERLVRGRPSEKTLLRCLFMIHSSGRAHQRGVAASDKQTRGSKLIKNGEVNSAPAEEMKFSQISRGLALKSSCFSAGWMIYKNGVFQRATVSHTYNLYHHHHYHHYSHTSQEGLEVNFTIDFISLSYTFRQWNVTCSFRRTSQLLLTVSKACLRAKIWF